MGARHLSSFALFVTVSLAGGCAASRSYPEHWHHADGMVHVFGAVPPKAIALRHGEALTVLEAVATLQPAAGDFANVELIRRAGAELLVMHVDVRRMILTGEATQNFMLRAGDVIYVP